MTHDKKFYTEDLIDRINMNNDPVEDAIMSTFDRAMVIMLFASFLNKADDNYQLLDNFFEQSKKILLSAFDEMYGKKSGDEENIVHQIFQNDFESDNNRKKYEDIIDGVAGRYKSAIKELFKSM